jgi:hypothetical protein
MRKKYSFTADSTFTHLKDKMHQGVTEHIIEDDQTKKLYHDVVSYGSWFNVSDSSVFMSHFLNDMGFTGFSRAYTADNCDVRLPWYPPHPITKQAFIEVPDRICLDDIEFGYSKTEESDDYKQTFAGKVFKIPSESSVDIEYKGEDVLKNLFGCSVFPLGYFKKGVKHYPFNCILKNQEFDTYDRRAFVSFLKKIDPEGNPEIYSLLQKFMVADVKTKIKEFEHDVGRKCSGLRDELLYRQLLIRENVVANEENLNYSPEREA